MIDLFDATPSHANFLIVVAFSKTVRLIPEENKRTQLCLQTKLSAEKSQSLYSQKLPWWAQQIYVTKEKSQTSRCPLKCYKNVLYAGPKLVRNILTNSSPSPVRPEKPGLTCNSAPCQKFHSKSSTCVTKKIYIWD